LFRAAVLGLEAARSLRAGMLLGQTFQADVALSHSHGPQFHLPTAPFPATLRVRIVTSQGGADMQYLFRNVKLLTPCETSYWFTEEPTS
jgi:hypothetical protein